MELNLELKQTQALTPQMIQFMEFLQLGALELREYLQDQLQENPVLEMDEHMTSPSSQQGSDRDQLLQMTPLLRWGKTSKR